MNLWSKWYSTYVCTYVESPCAADGRQLLLTKRTTAALHTVALLLDVSLALLSTFVDACNDLPFLAYSCPSHPHINVSTICYSCGIEIEGLTSVSQNFSHVHFCLAANRGFALHSITPAVHEAPYY